ncbi:lipase secretion chaperone [Roseateles sp. MS654]|uniref:lipase secretion chaperone n=1 Tax=Roseateles sp. MS654 TaxID=3412685 RepID=UPI003C2AF424
MSHSSDRPRGRRIAWALAAGLGSAILLIWLAAAARAPAAAEQPAAAFPWARAPAAASSESGTSPGTSHAVAAKDTSASSASLQGPEGPGLAGASSGVFRVDAQGRLVVDQPTRLRAEALLALHEGDALAARLDAELAGLPPAAAARARELVAQFEAYQTAQAAAFPPGRAPLVPEEGLAQLQAMQALRASHFGADAARQMFAQDDAVARRILELMREDTSTTRSMEEKAMRAQVRYDQERGAVPP